MPCRYETWLTFAMCPQQMNCQSEVDHHQEPQKIVHHMDTESYGCVPMGRLRGGQLAVGAVVLVLAKEAQWVELVVSTVMVVVVVQPFEVVASALR